MSFVLFRLSFVCFVCVCVSSSAFVCYLCVCLCFVVCLFVVLLLLFVSCVFIVYVFLKI